MAPKKYRVTELAQPFVREGTFSFRVRYAQKNADGTMTICALGSAPVFHVPVGGVVQTENPVAQQMLQNMHAPQSSRRNGQRHPEGLLFLDVTADAPPVNVDMDVSFAQQGSAQ
jgi:hypothetical protein